MIQLKVKRHPSGDPTPSEQDLLLTRELYMCGKVVDIEVLDHVIIGLSDHIRLRTIISGNHVLHPP